MTNSTLQSSNAPFKDISSADNQGPHQSENDQLTEIWGDLEWEWEWVGSYLTSTTLSLFSQFACN